jgi:hypothetical protein
MDEFRPPLSGMAFLTENVAFFWMSGLLSPVLFALGYDRLGWFFAGTFAGLLLLRISHRATKRKSGN